MRYRSTAGAGLFLAAVLVFSPGCGKKGSGEGEEIKALPDTLQSFSKKIEWLIPRSFESLEYACQNKADQEIDAAVNLNVYVPPEKFFALFEGLPVVYRSLYYGWEGFNAVYPVDPDLPLDSTVALMQLEARSRLTEQVRLVEEQVGNVTDEVQRKNVEADLAEMKGTLENVEAHGVMLYGGDVRAFPEDLKSIMFNPDGIVRVIFPGVPTEGSWVRMSPYRFDRLMQSEAAAPPPPPPGE